MKKRTPSSEKTSQEPAKKKRHNPRAKREKTQQGGKKQTPPRMPGRGQNATTAAPKNSSNQSSSSTNFEGASAKSPQMPLPSSAGPSPRKSPQRKSPRTSPQKSPQRKSPRTSPEKSPQQKSPRTSPEKPLIPLTQTPAVVLSSPNKVTRSTVKPLASPNVDSMQDDDEDNQLEDDGEESEYGGEDDGEESGSGSEAASRGSGDATGAEDNADGGVDSAVSDNSEHVLTVKPTSRVVRQRITKNGEEKYWMENTRKRVTDCKPDPEKTFMLYLPLSPVNFGSSLLIQTDINLQEMAVTRGGEAKYCNDRAVCFNQHHRKAKSQLNRSIMKALTCEPSPYQMARNVMSGKDGPMALCAELSHLGDIQGLKALFESDHLYTDEKVHMLWVGMFAAGVPYGCKRATSPQDTLDMMLDVDYEAHARYQFASRLEYQGVIHGYAAEELVKRSAGFRTIRKLVRLDRKNNLKAAEEKRLGTSVETNDDELRAQAIASGGLADTTDEEDDY